MDPEPRDPEDFHKIWTTSGSKNRTERKTLYEFADEDKYRKGGKQDRFLFELLSVIFRNTDKETLIRTSIYWECECCF